jgi:hypothetical protein
MTEMAIAGTAMMAVADNRNGNGGNDGDSGGR